MEISLDVLEQIERENLKAGNDYWSGSLNSNSDIRNLYEILFPNKTWKERKWNDDREELSGEEFQELLIKKDCLDSSDCKVCAIGAAMVSQIRLGNRTKYYSRELESLSSGDSKANKSFTPRMFEQMEFVYEYAKRMYDRIYTHDKHWKTYCSDTAYHYYEVGSDKLRSIYDFPFQHNTKENLMNIFLNVIANKGNFKVHDYTNYIEEFKIRA